MARISHDPVDLLLVVDRPIASGALHAHFIASAGRREPAAQTRSI
jgi:hypothetical protein